MFVYMKYTEEDVIWICVATTWLILSLCSTSSFVYVFIPSSTPNLLSVSQTFLSLSVFHFQCCNKKHRLYFQKWKSPNIYLWLKCDVRKKVGKNAWERGTNGGERATNRVMYWLFATSNTRTRSKRAVMGGWALVPCSVEQNGAVEMIHGWLCLC